MSGRTFSSFFATPRERRLGVIIVLLACLMLAQTAVVLYRWHAARARETHLVREVQRLRTVLGYSGMVLGLPESEAQKLKTKGLKDPATDIVCDLVYNRGYVLPKEYLGREIGFRFKSNVQILSSRWAMADFDDGRQGGKVLLEFKVTDNGRIGWRIIDSCLEKTHEIPDRV